MFCFIIVFPRFCQKVIKGSLFTSPQTLTDSVEKRQRRQAALKRKEDAFFLRCLLFPCSIGVAVWQSSAVNENTRLCIPP